MVILGDMTFDISEVSEYLLMSKGSLVFEVPCPVFMLAFKGQFTTLGVANVLMVVASIDTTATAFTVKFLSILDSLRAGFVFLVVLQLMPLGFGAYTLFE